MKNITKRLILLLATLVMLASFCSSSAFAASCLFGHKAVATPSVEATCTENGSYGGSYCSNCGTVIEEATVVPATGHTKSETPTITPATFELDGSYSYACVTCSAIVESGILPKIDAESIILSADNFIYNGEECKPTVTVNNAEGNALVEGQDYDVVYPESMIMPGKYEVTVIFKGNYSGESKLYFTIVPKATTDIKAKTANVNSITLQWTQIEGATGYEIYKYNASTKKYVKIDTVTTNSYKATGLKGNTTYKFKVRAYTEIADGSILYAANSNVFSTKTTYGVIFTGSSASIYIGGTKQLKATTLPANKKLTWKSSDTSIAKVSSSGKVTAVKKGTATITASFKLNGKTYKGTFEITVMNPTVKLNKTSATIKQGKTLKLIATTLPGDLKVTWKSSDTSVAKVSSNGKITARRGGTAKITASITYKGATYKTTCKVTVKQATAEENITRLINYIEKNGKTNGSGYKYIKLVDDNPAYDSVCTATIIYNKDKDCLDFKFLEEGGGLDRIITASLDRKGTYVNYKAEFNFYYAGYKLYSAVATDKIEASDYRSEYSLFGYWDWDRNTFPSELEDIIDDYLYVETDLAMSVWEVLMLSTADISFKDIGFINRVY